MTRARRTYCRTYCRTYRRVAAAAALAASLACATALLAGPGTAAAASAIYECGPGHYSERPCSGGTRYQPSQGIRQPTAEEHEAAQEIARREKRLGQELQADRQRVERESARRGVATLSPEALAPTAAGKKGKHEKKDKKDGKGRKDKPQRKSTAVKLSRGGGLSKQAD